MSKTSRKIFRGFKLKPELNKKLVLEAGKTRRTQTAIVELALEEWFKVKRGLAA